jgi:hypothetical protein
LIPELLFEVHHSAAMPPAVSGQKPVSKGDLFAIWKFAGLKLLSHESVWIDEGGQRADAMGEQRQGVIFSRLQCSE